VGTEGHLLAVRMHAAMSRPAMGIGWGLLASGGRTSTRSWFMATSIQPGDCVRLRDGRVAGVRESADNKYQVRVRRTTSTSHQFLTLMSDELERIECPKGWMSPTGYNRYLKVTLAKMGRRNATK
jgi:hypothetical protein